MISSDPPPTTIIRSYAVMVSQQSGPFVDALTYVATHLLNGSSGPASLIPSTSQDLLSLSVRHLLDPAALNLRERDPAGHIGVLPTLRRLLDSVCDLLEPRPMAFDVSRQRRELRSNDLPKLLRSASSHVRALISVSQLPGSRSMACRRSRACWRTRTPLSSTSVPCDYNPLP